MFGSRKQIRALSHALKETEALMVIAAQERDAWRSAAEAAKKDLNMWRQKYELSQLTPEVKADTEAAFKRGAIFGKTTMLNNIRDMVANLDFNEVENA